jgi:hypothetical protein
LFSYSNFPTANADRHLPRPTPVKRRGTPDAFVISITAAAQTGIDLPMVYRSFVAEVGNGPAGPFPLTEPLPGRIGTPADVLTRGTLMPAGLGCGTFIRLIPKGPRAGEVWQIDPD